MPTPSREADLKALQHEMEIAKVEEPENADKFQLVIDNAQRELDSDKDDEDEDEDEDDDQNDTDSGSDSESDGDSDDDSD